MGKKLKTSNLDTLGKYIDKIINLIVSSEDCVKLINPKDDSRFDVEDILLGGEFELEEYDAVLGQNVKQVVELQPYIYDYAYTVNPTLDDRTIICVDALANNARDNILTDFTLHIYVFTQKRLNRLSEKSTPTKSEMESLGYYGNRVNMLCSAVEKVIKDSDDIGGIGKVNPANNGYITLFLPHADYYGKHLTYNVYGYNDDEKECG